MFSFPFRSGNYHKLKKAQFLARDRIPTKVKSPSTSKTMLFHAPALQYAMWVRFSVPALGQLVPKLVVPGADLRPYRSDNHHKQQSEWRNNNDYYQSEKFLPLVYP